MSVSWIASLADGGIAADLSGLATNGSLSFAGAEQILEDVAARGSVTSAEFSSLQTIAAHLNNGMATSSYVASVFTQLVDGSPANATWTGGSTTPVALGNLAVGTTTTQMNELIGKWFLGTDLPNPDVNADPTTTPFLPTYSVNPAPLYGATGAAAISDVSQAHLGDCNFLSGLIDMVANHPSELGSMLVDNGNGTYGVRFYINGNETWVTVNNELPMQNGTPVYVNSFAVGTQPQWAELIEKAYAQLSSTGETTNGAVNSYSNINADDPVKVLQELTGCIAVTTYNVTSATLAADKQLLLNALANRDDIIINSPWNAPDLYNSSGQITLDTAHADAIIGYDSTTGEFIARNPWGVQNNTTYVAQFEVSVSDLASVGGSIIIDNSAPEASTLSVQAAPRQVLANTANQVSGLFNLESSTGAQATEYALQLTGTGSINLGGATNLATSAQAAQGEVVVSAADLAKVTITSGAAGTSADLSVSAYDGSSWSSATDIAMSVTKATAAIVPTTNPVVAPGATVSLSTLFHATGTTANGQTWFDVIVPANGGTINLNGAQNYWQSPTAGEYQILDSDLGKVTYTAPTNSGSVDLQVQVYATAWSGFTDVAVNVGGVPAAVELQDVANGQFASATSVVDTTANVIANIDGLQAALTEGVLQSITLTDTGPITVSLTSSQVVSDLGVLSMIEGNLGRITLTDATSPTLAVTEAQLTSNAAIFKSISGAYSLVVANATVAGLTTDLSYGTGSTASLLDTAANVSGGIDALQALVAKGQLHSIALSDGGVPALTLTAAQLVQDQAALKAVMGLFTVDVSAPSTGATITGLVGHGTTVVFSGDASQYAIAETSNSLIVTSAQGTTTLTDVTALQFSDVTDIVASQTPPVAGAVSSAQVTELYSAVLGRLPDVGGLAYYEAFATNNPATPFLQFAEWFLSSPEYTNNTAHNYAQTVAGDEQFITDSYQNLLHRTPSAAETAYYETNVIAPALAGLTPGTAAYAAADLQAHAQVLVYFSQSPEFLGDVQVTATNPSSSQHWLVLTSNSATAAPGSEAASTVLNVTPGAVVDAALINPSSITGGFVEVNGGFTSGGITANTNTHEILSGVSNITIDLTTSFPSVDITNAKGDVVYGSQAGSSGVTFSQNGGTVHLVGTGNVLYGESTLSSAAAGSVAPTPLVVDGFTTGDTLQFQKVYTSATISTLFVSGAPVQAINYVPMFGSEQLAINVGVLTDDSAATMAAAAAKVYTPLTAAQSVADGNLLDTIVFYGQGANNDTVVYFWRADSAHQVTAATMQEGVDLVGVTPAQLTGLLHA